MRLRKDRQRGCRAQTKGFTLLEVMISLAIIAGLLVTVLYSLNYHLHIAQRQEILMTATSLARIKIQEMEKNPSTEKGYFKEPYSGYYYETMVKDSSFPSMIEISVTVRFGNDSIRLAELIPSIKGVTLKRPEVPLPSQAL